MKQGEIWLIDLNPTKGAEIQKIRPSIIVSNNKLGKLPLKIIVPITDWKERYSIAPWMIKVESNSLTGLSKISCADCFQIRSVAEERLIKRIGFVDENLLKEIKEAISKIVDF
jgi:mRNA interferase MazF